MLGLDKCGIKGKAINLLHTRPKLMHISQGHVPEHFDRFRLQTSHAMEFLDFRNGTTFIMVQVTKVCTNFSHSGGQIQKTSPKRRGLILPK